MKTLNFRDYSDAIQKAANELTGIISQDNVAVGFLIDGYLRLVPVGTAVKVALIRASKLTQDEYINGRAYEIEWHNLVTDVETLNDKLGTWEEFLDLCAYQAFSGEEVQILRVKPNRAQCLTCNEIIESKHRHDFVKCACGNIFIDGGLDYFRAGWRDDLASFKVLDWPEFDNMASDAQV